MPQIHWCDVSSLFLRFTRDNFQTKSLCISRVVSYFYGTELEFGTAGQFRIHEFCFMNFLFLKLYAGPNVSVVYCTIDSSPHDLYKMTLLPNYECIRQLAVITE